MERIPPVSYTNIIYYLLTYLPTSYIRKSCKHKVFTSFLYIGILSYTRPSVPSRFVGKYTEKKS